MAEPTVKPFVEPGRPLDFVAELKDRGLWPPKLRGANDNGGSDKPTATPFLVVPSTIAPQDDGRRPQPNSKAFHSAAVWIEDSAGTAATNPAVGVPYTIKCRIRNLGAFPSYGGMADFFVNTPAAFNAAAGTATALPAIGHTGFSLLQGQETVITCPATWTPATPADLASSIVVHAYDPFMDNLVSRFDARNDRHVGRHDFTPDLYVRDWTDSAASHDDGVEPSTRVFYTTSDVWNGWAATPSAFVNDQPQNVNPQQGNGAAGDNFVFARISRNDASIEQTVQAHFLCAEFGTGSPFVDCSSAPDPAVTLLVGETSKVVSLPWHLHPTSSNHLCLAVQIYSNEDPYMPPGLLGYTPGWPTSDLMVINDNNKAQRNMGVWDGVTDTEGSVLGIVFNAATFKRDVTLAMDASKGAASKMRNARISIPQSGSVQEFKPASAIVLKEMMPGERRWVAFSWDGISFVRSRGALIVSFGEQVDNLVVNGFGFQFRPTTIEVLLPSVLTFQMAIFYRMSEGLGADAAKEGLTLCTRLLEGHADVKAYADALPALTQILSASLKGMSANFGGITDVFGIDASLKKLQTIAAANVANAVALHNKILHQTDALQTMAVKSRGDVADCPFTARLQKDVYSAGALASPQFDELRNSTGQFIESYAAKGAIADEYVSLVKSCTKAFEATAGILGSGPVKAQFTVLIQSLTRTPEEVQKAHLNFLNTVLLTVSGR